MTNDDEQDRRQRTTTWKRSGNVWQRTNRPGQADGHSRWRWNGPAPDDAAAGDEDRPEREQPTPGTAASEEPAPVFTARTRQGKTTWDGTVFDSQASTEAAEPKAKKRFRFTRRRVILLVIAALLLALGVWIIVEKLNAPESGGGDYEAGSPTTTGRAADPHSVRAGVTAHRLVVSGQLDKGCPMYVAPRECRAGWDDKRTGFKVKPAAEASAGLDARDDHPASTVVVVYYQPSDSNVTHRRAVLVRDSDHKVVDTESLGSEETGLSLRQVGEKMREETS